MFRLFAILLALDQLVVQRYVPYRFIKWIAEEETIQMFGDGSQSRDFTYVDDIEEPLLLLRISDIRSSTSVAEGTLFL